MESNLTPIIKESFEQYAGAVLQSRALVDVRDCIKPSARQIFYALYTDKYTYDKPFKKTLKAVGSLSRFYIHGDASAVGVLMRAGQPFSMRYPLIDIKGNGGTLHESGNWAHQRYTETRLEEITSKLFQDIDKETITEWRDNYDDTEQYPSVLPSKGFYNIVNGTAGIGVGLASSIPQFNLKEVNEALIKLLWNPDISFDEIYCAPDFATGAILLNEAQVKESLRKGTGFACKLRSVVEWNTKERCLIVSEIPYSVYTNTICKELNQILDDEGNPGIERFNDLTGKTPLIKIYLTKAANPERVLRYLYKNTSLQSHYGINMTMLKDGRFPKVYGWREALQAHIDHEKVVYRRGFEYDLKKIDTRLIIIEGLLKAISCIDEVIATIKGSNSSGEANLALQKLLSINETQAKAILDIKLSRLTKLDISKLENEKKTLEAERERITLILQDEVLFKKEIEKGLREVASKFGDARRTQILNLQEKEDGEEIIEEKRIVVSLTNYNNLYVNETSTLMTQKRNSVGSKLKLEEGEYVIETISDSNLGSLMLFSDRGRYYNYELKDLSIGKTACWSILQLGDGEHITNLTTYSKAKDLSYIVFVTKDGLVKKSLLEDYKARKVTGAQGIKLKEGDEVVSISFVNEEPIGILSKKGQFVIITTKDIRPIGRIATGVKGIKLGENDYAVYAMPITDCKDIITVSKNGMISRTDRKEFSLSGRDTKGTKIQKLGEDDEMRSFCLWNGEEEILVASTGNALRFPVSTIPTTGRGAQGVRALKLGENNKVINAMILKN